MTTTYDNTNVHNVHEGLEPRHHKEEGGPPGQRIKEQRSASRQGSQRSPGRDGFDHGAEPISFFLFSKQTDEPAMYVHNGNDKARGTGTLYVHLPRWPAPGAFRGSARWRS